MENRIQVLASEIKQIYEQYIREVGSGGRKVWPRAIKDRALELDSLMHSSKEAAKISGLPVDTIYLWRSEVKKSKFKSLPVVRSKSVTVTDAKLPSPQPRTLIDSSSVTVTVTTPKGFKLEGLSARVALEIVLKLEGRS